jgi:hypothetical protein
MLKKEIKCGGIQLIVFGGIKRLEYLKDRSD